jgi:hypothetical protein
MMRSAIGRAAVSGLGLAIFVLSVASNAYAGVPATVPEIGGSSIPAALGILSAGVLMLRAARGRSKK